MTVSNIIPGISHNLPQVEPVGDDWKVWAERLLAALPSFTANLASEASQASILPLIDTSGRTIIDATGVYAYNAAGGNPIAPDLFTIDTQDLVDLAITTPKLALLAVDSAQIKDAAILSAKIGDLQVVRAKIDDLAINQAKIANLAVGNAQILNIDAIKITTGLLKADRIEIDGLTLESDGGSPPKLRIKADGVDTAQIADFAVSTTEHDLDVSLTPTATTFTTILTLTVLNGTSDDVEVVLSTSSMFLAISDAAVEFKIIRNDGSDVTIFQGEWNINGDNGLSARLAVYIFMDDGLTGGGTITYTLQYKLTGTGDSMNDRVNNIYFRVRQVRK